MLTRSMRRFAAMVSNDVKKGQTMLNIHHVYIGLYKFENTHTVYYKTKPVPLNQTQNIFRDLSRNTVRYFMDRYMFTQKPVPHSL